MNFRKLILIAAACAFVAVSCKKDEDTETKPSLRGTMRILDLPEFISPNQKITMRVKGGEHPEGKEMGFYWKVVPGMSSYDTTRYEDGLGKDGKPSDGSFEHTFKDTLATFTVYCYAYASGYNGNSATIYTTSVKSGPKGSITGIDYPADGITTIGNQTWTTANLSEGTAMPFREAEIMSDIFGRYYNFEQAQIACESLGSEWKLPTKEDWETLEAFVKDNPDLGKSTAAALMGNASFNKELMWEYWPSVGDITNGTGFSAIPVGYSNLTAGSFTGSYEYAAFWTATTVENEEHLAYYKYLICDQPDMFTGKADKESFGASVRCIRK